MMFDFSPLEAAEIVYSPGFINGKRYWPWPFVVSVRDSPESADLMVTVAPGTTAPEVSVTTPTASAVVMVWLNAAGASIGSAPKKQATAKRLRQLRFVSLIFLTLVKNGTPRRSLQFR